MTLTIKPRAQAHFASVWLKDQCTIIRASGFGANTTTVTVATGASYKHEEDRSPQLTTIDGGFRAIVSHMLKFAVGEDVQVEDVVTDNTTGQRFVITGDATGSFKFLQTFTAIEHQDSS